MWKYIVYNTVTKQTDVILTPNNSRGDAKRFVKGLYSHDWTVISKRKPTRHN